MLRPLARHPFVLCSILLLIFEIWLQCFRLKSWEAAGARGLLLLAGLVFMLALPVMLRGTAGLAEGWTAGRRRLLLGLIGLAILWNLVVSAIAVVYTAETGDIRMDQGQATYSAARALLRGENPYSSGNIFDYYSYIYRMPLRTAASIGPTVPEDKVIGTLDNFWWSQDKALRRQLLPVPGADASPEARREAGILGYKYGPVPIMATALLAPLLKASAVSLVNTIGTWAMFGLLLLILKRQLGRPQAVALAVLAILLDHFPTWYYIHFADSDIWPLFFCVLAVYAVQSGQPVLLGLALALALGCKVFPSLLYLPLLVLARSPRAALVWLAASLAIFLPWLAWDAQGIKMNFFLWPAYMEPDITSWVRFAARSWVVAARGVALAFAGFLVFRLVLRGEQRLFWTLAMINMAIVLVGTVIHNNYVPWFSIWGLAAIVEAFVVKPDRSTAATA